MNDMAHPEAPSDRAGPDSAAAGADPRLIQIVRKVLIASPVAQTLGVELVALAVDRAVLALPFKRENVTVGDVVHGGVIAALIDIAGSAAAASGAEPESLRGGATSTLSISYLAPAEGAALRAEATVIRRGRRQVVSDVAVFGDDVMVAKALVTTSMF